MGWFTPKKNVKTYKLIDRSGRATYIGTTNNLWARAAEHRESGKKFSRIVPTSGRLTRRQAEWKEKRNLGSFRQATGRNPKYNKTNNGKFNDW